MMDDNNEITALLAMLSKARPPAPTKRRERFLQLYHELEGAVDMNSLSEAEYERLFNALTTACGFEDPMDALEALAERKGRRSQL